MHCSGSQIPFQKPIARVRSGRSSHKPRRAIRHLLTYACARASHGVGCRHRGLSLNDEKHRSGGKSRAHERKRETALFQQLGDPIRHSHALTGPGPPHHVQNCQLLCPSRGEHGFHPIQLRTVKLASTKFEARPKRSTLTWRAAWWSVEKYSTVKGQGHGTTLVTGDRTAPHRTLGPRTAALSRRHQSHIAPKWQNDYSSGRSL